MSFLKPIADMIGEDYSLQFIVKMKNGKMTVTFIPKFESQNKEITNRIQPLNITDEPAELDRTIISIISNSMHSTRDFASALKEYEAGLEAAKKDLAKASKDKKADPKPAAKPEATAEKKADPAPLQTKPVEKKEEPAKVQPETERRAVRLEDLAGEDLNEADNTTQQDEAPWDTEENNKQDDPEQTTEQQPAQNEEEDEEW